MVNLRTESESCLTVRGAVGVDPHEISIVPDQPFIAGVRDGLELTGQQIGIGPPAGSDRRPL